MDTEKEHLFPTSEGTLFRDDGVDLRKERKPQRYLFKDIAILLLAFTNVSLLGYVFTRNNIKDCVKRTSAYSPLYDRFDIRMSDRMSVNASLPLNEPHSKFRGPPSPELDAAWEHITTTHLFPLSREEVVKMGKDPDYTVLMPEEFGFGPDYHAGFMDVFHNIHCLDFLRREAHSDYYGAASKSPLGQAHLDHCVEILLEDFLCRPNMGVITYTWMDDHPMPIPDFVQNKKCWDFEQVISWKETHSHINDRGYYEDYYRKLRYKVKQTPATPAWQKLTKAEALWLANNKNVDEGTHHRAVKETL